MASCEATEGAKAVRTSNAKRARLSSSDAHLVESSNSLRRRASLPLTPLVEPSWTWSGRDGSVPTLIGRAVSTPLACNSHARVEGSNSDISDGRPSSSHWQLIKTLLDLQPRSLLVEPSHTEFDTPAFELAAHNALDALHLLPLHPGHAVLRCSSHHVRNLRPSPRRGGRGQADGGPSCEPWTGRGTSTLHCHRSPAHV